MAVLFEIDSIHGTYWIRVLFSLSLLVLTNVFGFWLRKQDLLSLKYILIGNAFVIAIIVLSVKALLFQTQLVSDLKLNLNEGKNVVIYTGEVKFLEVNELELQNKEVLKLRIPLDQIYLLEIGTKKLALPNRMYSPIKSCYNPSNLRKLVEANESLMLRVYITDLKSRYLDRVLPCIIKIEKQNAIRETL